MGAVQYNPCFYNTIQRAADIGYEQANGDVIFKCGAILLGHYVHIEEHSVEGASRTEHVSSTSIVVGQVCSKENHSRCTPISLDWNVPPTTSCEKGVAS
eukprot:9494443-Pyramimonas_sp.AAC.2